MIFNKGEFEKNIDKALAAVKTLLIEKNKKYGDSALSPIRVFSSVSDLEQINVRIDDKLSRIRNIGDEDNEDTINDLIGYLVLYKIKKGEEDVKP